MPKTKLRDLVVILPGITGSVLQKDGKDIWNYSSQSVWQLIQTFGDSLDRLKLPENPSTEDFDDGIRATSLVRGAHIIPGLEKVLGGYHLTSRLIKENFEVIEGNIFEDKPANFYEFPYDWRLDNRINAQRLKTFLDRQLPIWREHTGLKDAKVILLAHSMGGLISRYYLEVLEGWQDCKALFTFGTPYRGSINAIDFLANGQKLLKVVDLTDILRSFPSVYQLLPRQPVLKIGDGYQSIAQSTISLPNINPNMALDAEKFHDEIEAAVNRHLEDAKYLKSYKIIPIVGIKQTTKQSALLVDGKITISATELPQGIDPIYGDGDGTVPYWSAIPQELSYEYRETCIAEQHGAIQSNAEVLRHVRDRIRGMQAQGLGDIRGPEVLPDIADKAAISLSVDDLYSAGEAITIRAQLKDTKQDFGGIQAEIRSLTAESSLQPLQLNQTGDRWSIETGDLAPGVYQVTVQTVQTSTGAPAAVRDVFEIIGTLSSGRGSVAVGGNANHSAIITGDENVVDNFSTIQKVERSEKYNINKEIQVESQASMIEIPIFFATDRQHLDKASVKTFYGGKRNLSSQLEYGIVKVTIPEDHRMGKIERPSWLKLEFWEDPAKHIVLMNIDTFDRNLFVNTLRKSVANSKSSDLLLFIHGYNTSFEDAAIRTAQIAYDLKFPGQTILYSWPSEAKFELYPFDANNIDWTLPHFEEFLNLLLTSVGAGRVNTIAHSMGNRIMVRALDRLNYSDLPKNSAKLCNVIFAAPDIDTDTFKQFAKQFKGKADRLTLYASSKDKALEASRLFNGYPRAGDSGSNLTIVEGLDTIDASLVDTSFLGHSYFGDNRSIISDIFHLIHNNLPPNLRSGLKCEAIQNLYYWLFQP